MNKSELRKNILAKREKLDKTDADMKSNIICDKIFSLYPDRDLCILAYSSIKNEVDTKKILSYYNEIYLPSTEGDKISFYRYNGNFIKGRFGVKEPLKEKRLSKKPDVIIIPGVAFDKGKNRVGYGKGYYDGFLKDYYDVPKIALAYSFQVVDNIDGCYENDVKMDRIITDEDDVLWVKILRI